MARGSVRTLVDLLGKRFIRHTDLLSHQLSHFAVNAVCTNEYVAMVLFPIFGGDDHLLCGFLIAHNGSVIMQFRFVFHVAIQGFQGFASFHKDNWTLETI